MVIDKKCTALKITSHVEMTVALKMHNKNKRNVEQALKLYFF